MTITSIVPALTCVPPQDAVVVPRAACRTALQLAIASVSWAIIPLASPDCLKQPSPIKYRYRFEIVTNINSKMFCALPFNFLKKCQCYEYINNHYLICLQPDNKYLFYTSMHMQRISRLHGSFIATCT